MIANLLKSSVLLSLIVTATACGGTGKPKDASKINSEPSSNAYPPQTAGDQNAADTLNVSPTQPADSTK